jgi:lipoprotein NlpD
MKALVLSALVGLAACSSLTNYQPQTYVVRSGDTLYSIAWRHGVDHRNLASWNGLNNPDRIYVGQRLVLSSQGRSQPVASQSPPAQGPVPGSAPRPAPSQSSQPRPVASGVPAGNQPRPPFDWPTRGNVVARFGERGILSTGIGIAGSAGQDVFAAAPGEVVYVGSGLPEYGQVVIIKHNESWLTAYGYNQRLLVGQTDSVARGQKIGEMGLGPGRTPRLYFEIRRNGDPLDPLTLLPNSG